MRKIYLSSFCLPWVLTALLLVLNSTGAEAQIKIGNNGTNIAPASLLELESTDRGLLIPRMPNTTAIDALNPPVGMLIYITTEPSGIYIKKTAGWEYLTGFLGGNAFFNSVTVTGQVTAGNFTGPLNGNATSANTAINATNAINAAIINDLSTPQPVYPTFVLTTPGNSQLRTSTTKLSFVPNTGILTATGFNGPLTGDVTGNATSATNAANASNTDILNEVASAAIHYPTFVTGTSGNLPHLVSSAGFNYIPATGTLTATQFSGSLLGNASTATSSTNATNAVNVAVTNDASSAGFNFPVFAGATTGNQGLKTGDARLRYRPSTGELFAGTFVGPLTGNVTGSASSATNAINATNIGVTADASATTMFPLFATATNGTLAARANAGLSFIPSTGILTAPVFSGSLQGNANTATAVTGTVPADHGGTGQVSYTIGNMLYASAPTTLDKIPPGTDGQVLTMGPAPTRTPYWSSAGTGTVTSILGSPSITISGTPTVIPEVSISATYPGQASISTVGTITAGTWNGSVIDVSRGGTGLATLPTNLLVGNGTGPVTTVSGPVGYVLTSTGPTTPPIYQPSGGGDMILNAVQNVIAAKTFDLNTLIVTGTGGRETTINASPGVGATTVELPPDGIIVNRDRVETLDNKTLNSPILVTPNIGAAAGASLATSGSISSSGGNVTAVRLISTIATGTAPFTVSSTTPVPLLSIGGNAATATTALGFSGALSGDVTGTQGATVVSTVGTIPATGLNSVFTGVTAANSATTAPTPGRLVLRDGFGNFTSNEITSVGGFFGNLTGTASRATLAETAVTQPPGDNTTAVATTAFVAAADALKANIASPALTGNPTAPTQPLGNNSTRIATTAFVNSALGMIKLSSITPNTNPNIGPGTETEIEYTAFGALATGTVVVSPVIALPADMGILSARISAPGIVSVKFRNFGIGVIAANSALNITVIQ